MLKFIAILFSFLFSLNPFKSYNETVKASEELTRRAFYHARHLFGTLAMGLIGLTILMVGFLTTYIHLLNQYDVTGTVRMTAMTSGGTLLFLTGLSLLLWSSGKKRWQLNLLSESEADQKTKKSTQETHQPSQIESAIALLIKDFIKERESRREQQARQETTTPQNPSSNGSFTHNGAN